jgi:hypothetical protein
LATLPWRIAYKCVCLLFLCVRVVRRLTTRLRRRFVSGKLFWKDLSFFCFLWTFFFDRVKKKWRPVTCAKVYTTNSCSSLFPEGDVSKFTYSYL